MWWFCSCTQIYIVRVRICCLELRKRIDFGLGPKAAGERASHVTSFPYRVIRVSPAFGAAPAQARSHGSHPSSDLVTWPWMLKVGACSTTLISPKTPHLLLPSFLFPTIHSYPTTITTISASAPSALSPTSRTSPPSHTTTRRLNPPSTLTQSGAFTDDLHTQSPRAITTDVHDTLSPTTNPNFYPPPRSPTNRKLFHLAICSSTSTPKPLLHHWSQNPATAQVASQTEHEPYQGAFNTTPSSWRKHTIIHKPKCPVQSAESRRTS